MGTNEATTSSKNWDLDSWSGYLLIDEAGGGSQDVPIDHPSSDNYRRREAIIPRQIPTYILLQLLY